MKKADILYILRSRHTVFTFKEILLDFPGDSAKLLKRRLHYYTKKGELYPIRRGLYAKDKNYDRFELATKIFTPSYVSFETILAAAGIIFQKYGRIFVASYQTKEVLCDGQGYSFRRIKEAILTNGAGIENRGNYSAASPERALLDVLYLNKEYHFDNLSSVDWDKVFAILPVYDNKRMTKTLNRYFMDFKGNRA